MTLELWTFVVSRVSHIFLFLSLVSLTLCVALCHGYFVSESMDDKEVAFLSKVSFLVFVILMVFSLGLWQ